MQQQLDFVSQNVAGYAVEQTTGKGQASADDQEITKSASSPGPQCLTTAFGRPAAAASAAQGRRLYLGNLAYATTEKDLQELFKDYLV